MGKVQIAIGLLAHTPLRHWPSLAVYFFGWACYQLFGVRVFGPRVLRFKNFVVGVDVAGLGGLVFLYEIIVKGVYDFPPITGDPQVKVIFDAGANCGFFALVRCANNPALRAYCFEPHPRTFSRLQRNIDLNSLRDRMIPIQAAVAASSGTCTLQLSTDSSMGVVTSSGSATSLENQLEVQVNMTSLDDFARQGNVKPDLLKIDVEGFEVEVLKGAEACLKACRHVIMECHSPKLTEECLALLQTAGFQATVRGALVFGSKLNVTTNRHEFPT